MKTKNSRLETLRMIISSRELGSQEELLSALQQEGFKLTQATLSRDLKQLKVAKAATLRGNYVYVLPNDTMYKRVFTAGHIREMLSSSGFLGINFSGNMGVIKTARLCQRPGMEHRLQRHSRDPGLYSRRRHHLHCHQGGIFPRGSHSSIERSNQIVDMEQETEIEVLVAGPEHEKYVDTILETIAEAAKVRGTGIAKRTHEYLAKKMMEAKAVIALTKDGRFAGFSYIETWEQQQYVTTSGLIVHPDFRGLHIAKRIKDLTFTLARTRWPHAKIFSLTSGAAVMKMNTALGYQPVTFADLTDDEAFWKGCEGCVNYPVLRERNRKFCICTAMLFDPTEHLPVKLPEEVLSRIKHLQELEEN